MRPTEETFVTLAPAAIGAAVTLLTESTPLQYGLVGLVLIGGMFPIVRWMMRRMDFTQKDTAAAAKRKEEREERHIEHLGNMVLELRTINNNFNTAESKRLSEHVDILDRFENLERIVRKELDDDSA